MTVTIAAGHSKTVHLSLNAAGRARLRKQGTLHVKLVITQDGHTIASRMLTLRLRSHKRR